MHIDIDGRRLTIEPIKMRDLPAFLAAVEPIAHDILRDGIAVAILRHIDHVINATAIGAGVERTWLDDRTPDEMVDIAAAVMEVNADFFAERVMPRLRAAIKTLDQITSGGTNGSPDSSPPDLATQT